MTQPIIILTRPQLVENIGAVARAMMNCALTELRVVAPRDGWPSLPHQTGWRAPVMLDWIAERLFAASSGADGLLHQTQTYPNLPAAIDDLHYVYATTAREHAMVKPWSTPRAALPAMLARLEAGEKVGILFGPERTGLTHDDMTYANEVLCIPANPAHCSFNLAQAVLVIGYEWYQAQEESKAPRGHKPVSPPATKAALHGLIERLEDELETAGFFTTPEIRPTMERNIRHALQRAGMTDQEVRTWHGIVTALAQGPKRRKDQL